MNQNLSSFASSAPAVFQWLEANKARSGFAASLFDQASRRGSLSVGQIAAVQRIVAENAALQDAPSIDTSKLEAVFRTALGNGLKRPKLTIGSLRFSPASETGTNPGAIYVKDEGTYMGKVLHGRFSGRGGLDMAKRVHEIAADPVGAAIAHGKLTGNCAICSRPLSDPTSVDRGIGPICFDRFFS